MSIRTTSEILFERFCSETGIPCIPIPPESGASRQTPDYELHLQVPPVLAEVKQIDLNPEDKALSRQLRETGTFAFQHIAGSRVRRRISQAASQLKARAKPDQPTLLVIYNYVGALRGFTDPFDIMAAMYGLPEAVLVRNDAPTQPRASVFYRLAGSRGLTPEHNTTISAIAVLFEGPEGPYLVVYYNQFAANPIGPEILRRYGILQWNIYERGPGKFPEWVAV
jgi:hypothetical protein